MRTFSTILAKHLSKTAIALIFALIPISAAHAAKLEIDVPNASAAENIAATYQCSDGSTVPVRYVNVGANALAVLPVAGQTLIFVQGPSADGARYVSGFYAWWSKGNGGSLFDLRSADPNKPVTTCSQSN